MPLMALSTSFFSSGWRDVLGADPLEDVAEDGQLAVGVAVGSRGGRDGSPVHGDHSHCAHRRAYHQER